MPTKRQTVVRFDLRGAPVGSFAFDGWLPAHKARPLAIKAASERFGCEPEAIRTSAVLHVTMSVLPGQSLDGRPPKVRSEAVQAEAA